MHNEPRPSLGELPTSRFDWFPVFLLTLLATHQRLVSSCACTGWMLSHRARVPLLAGAQYLSLVTLPSCPQTRGSHCLDQLWWHRPVRCQQTSTHVTSSTTTCPPSSPKNRCALLWTSTQKRPIHRRFVLPSSTCFPKGRGLPS